MDVFHYKPTLFPKMVFQTAYNREEGIRIMKYRYWLDQPAADWELTLPIGNGRLGASVWGNIEDERITANEETMWGGKEEKRRNSDAGKSDRTGVCVWKIFNDWKFLSVPPSREPSLKRRLYSGHEMGQEGDYLLPYIGGNAACVCLRR